MEISEAFLFLFIFVFVGTKCNEVIYRPKITDSMFSCPNFENKVLDCSGLVLGSTKGLEGEEATKLGGEIVTNGELISHYDVEIDVWKVMEIGDEYMYNTRANFCGSLENSDAPWYPVVESLNITGCPVPIKTFEVADLTISLDCVKDVMCHDFCGQYRIEISMMDATDKVSCHSMELSIVEEEVEKEE